MITNNLRLWLILILLGLVSCNSSSDYKTIILRTSGYAESPPDEANISLQIDCVNKNIQLAKKCLIAKTDNLDEILLKFRIEKKDILTTRINLNKDYTWINNSEVFNGYRASVTVNIKIRDLKILDSLYSELLSDQELSIGNLIYQHSKIDSLYEIAYVNALKNADKIIEKILSQLPEKNKEIIRISNIEIPEAENNVEHAYEENKILKNVEKNNVTINIGNMIAERQLYIQYKIY